MKKSIITVVLIGLMASITQAFAGAGDPNKFYLSVRGGAYWLDAIAASNGQTITLDAGYSVTGSVGYEMFLTDFGNFEHPVNLRLEVESGYAQVSKEVLGSNVVVESVPVMFNAILDYYITSKLYVYGGVGAGLLINNSSWAGFSENTNSYAVQARAGLGYQLNEVVGIEVGYRIFSEKFQRPLGQFLEGGIVFRF